MVDAGAEVADLVGGTPISAASSLAVPCTEWQRPTVRISGVMRDSAAQLIAIGLTYCSISAFGQSSAMSRAMSISTGRGAQAAHDAADAERVGDGLAQPALLRHLEVGDRAGLVAGDLDHQHDVVGVLQRPPAIGRGGDLRLRVDGRGDALGTPCEVASRFSSMSIRLISQSLSSFSERMSPTRFFMNTVEPAPIMAIFVMRMFLDVS